MAYLAVNKNGQEIICQNKPERWGYKKRIFQKADPNKNTTELFYMERADYKKEIEELCYWDDSEILNMGEFFIDYSIEVPIGTIKKLIGIELTWDDEPVEI